MQKKILQISVLVKHFFAYLLHNKSIYKTKVVVMYLFPKYNLEHSYKYFID